MRNNLLLFLCLFLFALLLWSGCVNNKNCLDILSPEEYEQRMTELREPGEQKIAQLLEAAERGDAEAQYQIGYENVRLLPLPGPTIDRAYWGIVRGEGLKYIRPSPHRSGFIIDREEGIKWFHKAAEQGHVEAQYQLGMAYAMSFHTREDGITEIIDREEGIKWLHKAAEQGHVDAHFMLGFCYLWQEDRAEAIKWFRQAELLGLEGASEQLRRMEELEK